MNDKNLQLVAAVLLCTTIVSGAYALQYTQKYAQLMEDYEQTLAELDDYTVLVDLLVDTGESVTWYNDTRVNVGVSLFDVSSEVLDLEYDVYDFGVFITGINGLSGDATHYWGWSLCEEEWVMGSVGADQYTVHDGDILAWTYTSFE